MSEPMVFLRSVRTHEVEPSLRGERVYMRLPAHANFLEWASLRHVSRDFLKRWEPTWPHDDLTRLAFRHRVKRAHRDARDDMAYSYFIFAADSDEILGGITLSNVRRGVAQSASLGYWIGAPHAGRGYMSEAVNVLLGHSFDELNLHRIEAACLASNEPSRRLLLRQGFVEEGYARGFLKIDGRWQDHLLFATLRTDLRA